MVFEAFKAGRAWEGCGEPQALALIPKIPKSMSDCLAREAMQNMKCEDQSETSGDYDMSGEKCVPLNLNL